MTTVPKGLILQTQETVDTTASSPVLPATGSTPLQAGPTVTITPQRSTSKIRVTGNIVLGSSVATIFTWTIYKDGVAMTKYIGDTRGSRSRVTGMIHAASNNRDVSLSFEFEDDPGDTLAHTYDIRFTEFNGSTNRINRSNTDTDNSSYTTAASWMKAEEISQ